MTVCEFCSGSGWMQLARVDYKPDIGARSHLVARWDKAKAVRCKCQERP